MTLTKSREMSREGVSPGRGRERTAVFQMEHLLCQRTCCGGSASVRGALGELVYKTNVLIKKDLKFCKKGAEPQTRESP